MRLGRGAAFKEGLDSQRFALAASGISRHCNFCPICAKTLRLRRHPPDMPIGQQIGRIGNL